MSEPVSVGRAGLLLRHGPSGQFSAPAVTGYAQEDQLQQILFDHPSLVPGVSLPAVACREFQSGVGTADVLIVGADGSLVVVECKLASNPQVRREVMGQVLDYASRLWRMPIEEFERRWADRTGTSPFADFADQALAREELARRLAEGRFTVVLAVDGINADLQRMVEYMNAVTVPDVQVLAFEVARVADGDVEILLPRVYGAELAQAKTPPLAQPSWTRQEYLDWMDTQQPALAPAMRDLLVEATGRGLGVANGTAYSPSVILAVPTASGNMWPASLFTEPRCTVQVRIYQVADRGGDTETLLTTLAALPGAGTDVEGIRARRVPQARRPARRPVHHPRRPPRPDRRPPRGRHARQSRVTGPRR